MTRTRRAGYVVVLVALLAVGGGLACRTPAAKADDASLTTSLLMAILQQLIEINQTVRQLHPSDVQP